MPVSRGTRSSARYTVRLELQPSDRVAEYRVVTSGGELGAAVTAALRQTRLQPEERITWVEVVRVEQEFTLDPEHDLLDYWEVS